MKTTELTERERIIITKYDLLFESRLTKVETSLITQGASLIKTESDLMETIKEIKTDLRWMLGIMLAFSGIILGLMAKGFHFFS